MRMGTLIVVVLGMIAPCAFADTNPALATVLTPDGAIMEGASGSFDPTGFRMTYGPEGDPLFVEESSLSGEPATFPGGQDDEGTWYSLGSGVNDNVYAIAVSGSDVYVGGLFTQAGGVSVNRIACWNGSSWSALGSGVNNLVRVIAMSGSDVYAGGSFTQVGGVTVSRIACWNGSSWSALGSGVNGTVRAIAVSCSDVYVGGLFTQAGGVTVNNIARWAPYTGIEPPPGDVSTSLNAAPNPTTAGTDLSFQSTGLSPLTLEIYNTSGRLVWMQALGTLPPDPTPFSGTAVATGARRWRRGCTS